MRFLAGTMLCLAALGVQCTMFDPLAGASGGSETTNGCIIGSLSAANGLPASGAIVMLIPWDHDPVRDGPVPDSMVDTAGAAGDFSLKAPAGAMFNIEIVLRQSGDRLLVTGLMVDRKDTLRMPARRLEKPGALEVVLSAPADTANGYVYLPGTTRSGRAREGTAAIDSVPAGFLPALYYANSTDAAKNHVVATNLTVQPGAASLIADLYGWRFSKRLLLNTTATGADVAQNVYRFPVLVRLTAANFDFSQAAGGGEDLRFTKSDDFSPLSFEVESWDPSAAAAVVWVKADTIYGNDRSHAIVMHWGAPGAVSMSNPAAVFDTAAGFQAVWHLNGSGSAACLDATANRFNGTPSDTAPSPLRAAAVGGGQSLNGSSNYFAIENSASGALNFPENGVYSLSAWVYAGALDSAYHMIVGKSDQQYGLQLAQFNMWEFVENASTSVWKSVRAPAQARAWTLLTSVQYGDQRCLYINGAPADSTGARMANSFQRDTTRNVMIGRLSPKDLAESRCFNGSIDEIRMASVAHSAAWVRLCYMNQKAVDQLVQFK